MKPLIACLVLHAAASMGIQLASGAEVHRLTFARLTPPRIALFVSDADGSHERPLLPATGLEYNASFSADGKWITFTSEREGTADIYRVAPDGSSLEKLVGGPAYDDQARLSPDGKMLAFVSTREDLVANIWTLDFATHRYRKLTTGAGGNFRPAWSPDGNWIAFTSDRDTNITRWDSAWELIQSIAVYVMHADGSGLRRLTDLGGFAGSPEWSLDGNSIIYYQSKPEDVYPGRFATMIGVPASRTGTAASQIIAIDVKTGTRKQLTTGDGLKLSPHYLPGGDVGYIVKSKDQLRLGFASGRDGQASGLRHPHWSPDGKTMVYQKSVPFQQPLLRPIFSIDPEFELFAGSGVFPAYSPSGKQLVMNRAPGMAIMDADGSNSRTLYDAQGKMLFFPAWSPDGKSVAFGLGSFFLEGKTKPAQLAMIQADGSGFHQLTDSEGNSGFPSFSPDGKRIVYRVSGKGERGLRIMSLEDGKITTLTTEYDNFPGWSPRGDRIAFTSFRDGNFEIYSLRPDGSDVRRLTNTGGNDAHSVWSPDGKWIIFSSSRRGWKDEALLNETGPQPYGELFAMHEDGTGVRQLTDNQWEDATPAWLPDRNQPASTAQARNP